MSNIRVVFSIDFAITRSLGVMGEFASLRGLKFNMALMILLEIAGRARIRMDREFRIASMSTASLIV
jgi:hypothetical protein